MTYNEISLGVETLSIFGKLKEGGRMFLGFFLDFWSGAVWKLEVLIGIFT